MEKNIRGGNCRHAHFSDDFKVEAVRLVATSGRPVRVIAQDLGIGLSTLSRWIYSIVKPIY